jgi:hypothetical protein
MKLLMYNSEYKARNQTTARHHTLRSAAQHKMELEKTMNVLKKDKMVFPKEKCTMVAFNWEN